MCGIAGFAGEGERSHLVRMAEAIRHRGPDDEGFFRSPGVGFAFRRLSIIDLQGGHQPMANLDQTVCVMLNGEIYGYKERRVELETLGFRFRTDSDTEVILHAYAAWGEECFTRLDGMFAIALWDVRQKRLILARDRFGKKPLYWTVKEGTVWFASELKALLAAGSVDRRLNVEAVGEYFRSDFVPTPLTCFEGVFKLEPATALVWHEGAVERTWRFWTPPFTSEVPERFEDALAGLRSRLDTAVANRLIADVPLGLFLSGGIDSSVVAESAVRQSAKRLQSFSIGFSDASYDERPFARMAANHLGLDHHEEVLDSQRLFGMLDESVKLLDEPLADPAILPQLLLSRFARTKLTVALSGDGGDELFLGYPHIAAHAWRRRLSFLPPVAFRLASRAFASVPASAAYFGFGFTAQRTARGVAEDDPWKRDVDWRGSFLGADMARLFVDPVPDRTAQRLQSLAQEMGEDDFFRAWTWVYLRSYLMDDVLVKVDRASMWNQLEVRSPLLDTSVVEYALRIPSRFKTGRFAEKALLKALVKGRLPEPLLRRKKHGFGVPVAQALRHDFSGLLDEVTADSFLRSQGLFDPAFIRQLREQHAKGRPDRRKELWTLLMFQLWYRSWMMQTL